MDELGADARLLSLAGRMTLEEKIGQLTMLADGLVETGPPGPHNPFTMIQEGRVGSLLNVWGPELVREAQRRAVEETRLGVPLFFGLDVLHGHRTIHPVPLAEAGAFDRALWEATARDSAVEAVADGVHLTFGPMLDVCRDPRWGRIVECAGEDAYVTAQYAQARVRGFQAPAADGRMRMAACAKHFCAYGAAIAGRDYAEADVSERALEEIYLPPFKAAVDAGVASVMPAFLDVAGVAMTAHRRLLRGVLRERWGFEGLLISDYNAIGELMNHGVAADLAEAAALSLKAGVDIDMMSDAYARGLPEALARGLVTMADIDEALMRVLRFKQAMGLFEDPYRNMAEGPRKPLTPAARALSREAARRSIVLATNRDALLPLPAARTLAIIGPLADQREDQLGPWASAGAGEDTITFRAALQQVFAHTRFAPGARFEATSADEIAAARDAMAGADVVALFIGESRLMSGEAATRTSPEIPAAQLELARAVLETGLPVILTLCGGRPFILPDWLVDGASAIFIAWHAGTEAGPAFAELLTGVAAPSARLAVTWPRVLGQVPIHYGLRPTGRPHDPTNSWSTGFLDAPFAPRFAFGEGLSYTRFTHGAPRVDRTVAGADDTITLTLDVTNVGDRAGVETVFLFVRDPVAQVTRPVLELKDFTQIALAPGETRAARFTLPLSSCAYLDEDLQPRLDAGVLQLHVGASARSDALQRIDVMIGPQAHAV